MYSRTSSISLTRSFAGWKLSTCNRTLGSALTRQRDRYLSGGVLSSGILQLLLRFFLLFAGICVIPQVKAANEVILSPIDPAGTTRAISLFSGSNLPANSFIRIGTFANGGTSEAELSSFVSSWTNQATTSSFLDFLNTNFVTWNSLTNTNANSPWPGASSISLTNANSATNLVGKPMYIWIYNTSTHAAATNSGSEMLILRSWETNSLGDGFPDKDGGSFGPDSNFNFFPSGPSGIDFPNPDPDDPLPITSYGVSVLFGQYLSDQLQFRLGGVTPRVEITSPLTETNASGAVSTYQITANNGADRFFATTNTASADLTLTNLPTGFSIATNTGVITAGTNASAGTYSIRLVASNSLTASVATNTLIWTLQASTLSFTTTTSLISAVAGVEISPFTFVSTGTSPTYTADGNLRGLTLSTNGVLSGIPSNVGTNDVTITSSAGGQNGATIFSLAVTAPTISVPAGALTGGQIVVTAGTATTINFSNTTSARFTNLTGSVSPTTTGVTFTGTDLLIATDAVPLLKGTTNVTLTLTASRAVGGSTVSASTSVPLRIVAPAPTALVGPTEFEVDVGEAFSTTILSDVGSYGRMNFSNLPSGLAGNRNGVVEGTNSSTNLPYEFAVKVVADSTQIYEGGGTYTNTNVIFRLRNTNAPYFAGTNRYLLAVGRAVSGITLNASNFPFKYTASNLPAGLQLNGNRIFGVPTVATNSEVQITAYNSSRPGSTNPDDEQPGFGTLILNVAGARPTAGTPLSGSSNLRVGNAASFSMLSAQELGLRISGYGFPPGLSINSSTGLVTGTPTAAGSYSVTLFLQNGKGWIKKNATLTVQ
jgi:hypothetical protein